MVPIPAGSLRTFVSGTGRVYIPQIFLVLSGGGFDPTNGDCYFFVFFRLGLRLLFFSLAAALGLVVRWCFL